MRTAFVAIGVIASLVGIVWTLQGADILMGSVMTGSSFWLAMGILVLAVGIVLGAWGARSPGAKRVT